MSDIKHIGALTIGIIGESLMNRNEKIKAILEANTPISYNADFGRFIDKEHLKNTSTFELEDKKDD